MPYVYATGRKLEKRVWGYIAIIYPLTRNVHGSTETYDYKHITTNAHHPEPPL